MSTTTTKQPAAEQGGWIQTFTGKVFYPLEPRAEDVCITDIAHALSMKCRFNGHCRVFYSVAQHSVLVCDQLAHLDPIVRLAALLHDAAEAYLPDVCRPIKGRVYFGSSDPDSIEARSFKQAEIMVMDAILRRFNLLRWTRGPGRMSPSRAASVIKHADDVALATEARDVMGPPPRAWDPLPEPLAEVISPVWPELAKELFLRRFGQLTAMIRDEQQETQAT